ncbi:hypothetical protein M2132_000882 [Dysgonomonas sp. PH5-45]|uniref:hypothetical protein n=1 Tax=unclassified Dysgonomonas TaxID=2630389 RepID=UPI00247565B8|nr:MULTISPECIES: hypothetical protein [unclassified Dysgonomonas]MDH6354554.1 hypothetical protein [Dysgonomonas sp. PH5-45]MDH6387390.1 hypothetical protein [Dysgonomonas sp. PH5-37]
MEYTFYIIIIGLLLSPISLAYEVNKVFKSTLMTKEEIRRYVIIICALPIFGIVLYRQAESRKRKERYFGNKEEGQRW